VETIILSIFELRLAAAIEKAINGNPARGFMFLFGTPFDPLLAGIIANMPLSIISGSSLG
jgi:hypothetical protein